MKEVATLNFIDFGSKDEALIIIRATKVLIASFLIEREWRCRTYAR
jgi:hypothetical protein